MNGPFADVQRSPINMTLSYSGKASVSKARLGIPMLQHGLWVTKVHLVLMAIPSILLGINISPRALDGSATVPAIAAAGRYTPCAKHTPTAKKECSGYTAKRQINVAGFDGWVQRRTGIDMDVGYVVGTRQCSHHRRLSVHLGFPSPHDPARR